MALHLLDSLLAGLRQENISYVLLADEDSNPSDLNVVEGVINYIGTIIVMP